MKPVEKLVNRNEWYKWFMLKVECSSSVKMVRKIENNKEILYLEGARENIRIVLDDDRNKRIMQYTSLSDWAYAQDFIKKDDVSSIQIKASNAFAEAMDMDLYSEPEEVLKSMLEAMSQIAESNDLDLKEVLVGFDLYANN